jgi:hypothetical protein
MLFFVCVAILFVAGAVFVAGKGITDKLEGIREQIKDDGPSGINTEMARRR